MSSSFENLPTSREHSDDSAVAEAVWRELQRRGEHAPGITDLAEMLDPKDVEAYTREIDEKKREYMLKKLAENVLGKEAAF